MRRAIAISGALIALAVPAAANAQDPAHVAVGISEQSPDLFEDARFQATGIHDARLIVPYDVVRMGGFQLYMTDLWLERARQQGIEPLVSFSRSFRKRRPLRLPSVREYSKRVSEFRARYPWVHQFSTWNEANHTVQPTGRHPRRTAVFYRALKQQCLDCTVLATDVLLTHSWKTWRWIRRFRERAGPGPHIFGLHNYPDVTRLRNLNTRLFLRRVPRAEVWLTETGGVVRFAPRWRYSETRAARAVRHVFTMASAFPRVTRVYLYNWRADDNRRWDSGLISREGLERRGYFELLDALALDRFRPLGPPVLPPPLPEPVPLPLPPLDDHH
jgi:polysaccharide biosynthesis protein PslG